jgi:hypothetical protein
MDVALLNYLQTQNALDKDGIKMPVQEEYNPFDHGIKRAIQTARESLGMNESQRDRAMRNALGGFSRGLTQYQPAEGTLGKIALMASALGPAVDAYSATEDSAIAQNNQIANQILAAQKAERDHRDTLAEREWHRNMAERQFAENKRAHQEAENYRNQQLEETKRAHQEAENYRNQQLQEKLNKYKINSEIDRIAPRIRTDSAFDDVGKQVKGDGAFLAEVQHIKNAYDNLEKSMQEAGIDITDPISWKNSIREASNIFSSFTKDPKLRKVAQDYSVLSAVTTQARLTAEAIKKGGGVSGRLSDFTIKYADREGLYPNVKLDTYDVFLAKLKDMTEAAEDGYDASRISMETGRFINKQNYKKVKELLESNPERYTPSDAPDNSSNVNNPSNVNNSPYINTDNFNAAPSGPVDDDLGIEWEGQ